MRNVMLVATVVVMPWAGIRATRGGDKPAESPWRALPLIKDGKVDPSWAQVGWGGFAVEDGNLRTECDEKGMGLLLYKKEKFGDCQIRVIYRSRDARSNSGVYVRIDAGILDRVKEKAPAVRRGKD